VVEAHPGHRYQVKGDEMSKRERFCPNCGESMGFPAYVERFETCGKRECERAARDAYQEERDERAYRAMQDDYERY